MPRRSWSPWGVKESRKDSAKLLSYSNRKWLPLHWPSRRLLKKKASDGQWLLVRAEVHLVSFCSSIFILVLRKTRAQFQSCSGLSSRRKSEKAFEHGVLTCAQAAQLIRFRQNSFMNCSGLRHALRLNRRVQLRVWFEDIIRA